MKYYSQCYQDKFINEIIYKNKKGKTFVDIGANDGISLSNTFFFEKELGWGGICVEPIKATFQKLQQNRKCLLINGCISNFDGKDVFMEVSGYGEMLSGLKSKYDPRHLKRLYKTLDEHGGTITEIPMTCYELNHLLKKNNIKFIDYLSVDTEGGELDILKSIDFSRFLVSVISVENNFKDKQIRNFLELRNFELIKVLESDEIYINKKKFNFLERIIMKKRKFR